MELDKSQIKILIVDDDVTFANQLYSQLDSEGYDVSIAFNAMEAKVFLFRVPFQIVLLDCLMPEMNGHTFAKDISTVFKSSIQFILMSGVFRKHDVLYMDNENIISMLEKPIPIEVLKKDLQQVTNRLTNPVSKNNFLTHLFEKDFSSDSLPQKIKEDNIIQKGDLIPLFSYLLRSDDYWLLKLSNEKNVIAQMVFKNNKIVHYRTNKISHARSFLTNKKLFEPKDLNTLLSSKEEEVMSHLMDHGLISPHHYFKYRKESLLKNLEKFQQENIQVSLEKRDESQALPEHEDVEGIPESFFIEKFTPLFQSRLPEDFLDQFINSFKDYEIFVQDRSKLDWMKNAIPFLNIFSSEDVNFDKASVSQFCDGFPQSKKIQVYKGLFWLISHGALSCKKNALMQLENLYFQRYSLLNKHIKTLNIQQVFQSIGCKDVSDKNTVKKVYHHYIKMNHVDKFRHFSSKLTYIIGQCNQIISNAYDTVMNEDKMSNYIQSSSNKEAEMIIEIEKCKESLVQNIKYKRYSQVQKLIEDIEHKLGNESIESQNSIKDDLVMWKMILDIEKKEYKLDEIGFIEMENTFKGINRFKVSLDVYFYLSCLFKVCQKQYKPALHFCTKSLGENEHFDLARLMKIKLNQWSKKSFGNWNSFAKKSS